MVAKIEGAVETIAKIRLMIGRVIFGQEQVIDETLITLLTGGHALLIGVPGLAKTRLVETLGTVMGLAGRVWTVKTSGRQSGLLDGTECRGSTMGVCTLRVTIAAGPCR